MTSSPDRDGEAPSSPGTRVAAPKTPAPETTDKAGEEAKLRERAKAQAVESTNEDG